MKLVVGSFFGLNSAEEIGCQDESVKSYLRLEQAVLRVVPCLLGIYVFANPFPHNTTIQTISFWLAVLFAVWMFIGRHELFVPLPPLAVPLLVYVVWAALSFFWSLDPGNTIHDLRSHLVHGALLFYLIYHFLSTPKKLTAIFLIFALSAVIFSIWQLGVYYFYLDHGFSAKLDTGLAQVPVNWIGYFAVIAVFILIGVLEGKRCIWFKCIVSLALLPLISIIFATQSRMTVVTLFICTCILLCKKIKLLTVFLIVFSSLLAVSPVKDRLYIYVQNPMAGVRMSIYLTALEVIKDYPVAGIGYGHNIYGSKVDLTTYNNKLPAKYRMDTNSFRDTHSQPLAVTVKLGLVGLFFYAVIIGSFFRLCFQLIRQGKNRYIRDYAQILAASGAAFMSISVFEPAHAIVPETIFFILLATGAALDKINRQVFSPVGGGKV